MVLMKVKSSDTINRIIFHPMQNVISEFNDYLWLLFKPGGRHEKLVVLLLVTSKYPLRGYILGVLTHTTAWDRHWGGDEILIEI